MVAMTNAVAPAGIEAGSHGGSCLGGATPAVAPIGTVTLVVEVARCSTPRENVPPGPIFRWRNQASLASLAQAPSGGKGYLTGEQLLW